MKVYYLAGIVNIKVMQCEDSMTLSQVQGLWEIISPGLEAGVKQAENWNLIKELLILPFVLQISIKGFNMMVKL